MRSRRWHSARPAFRDPKRKPRLQSLTAKLRET
jgi:hypothetical protein